MAQSSCMMQSAWLVVRSMNRGGLRVSIHIAAPGSLGASHKSCFGWPSSFVQGAPGCWASMGGVMAPAFCKVQFAWRVGDRVASCSSRASSGGALSEAAQALVASRRYPEFRVDTAPCIKPVIALTRARPARAGCKGPERSGAAAKRMASLGTQDASSLPCFFC